MKKFSYAYIIVVALLAFSIFIPPVVGFFNDKEGAFLHSLFKPLCHQYVYRSLCMQKDFPYITNCLNTHEKAKAYILLNEQVIVRNITFSKQDVGKIRPYKIETDRVKYVFPVCARDTGFYLGMFLGVFAFLVMPKKRISIWIYLALVAPFLLDGVLQLLLPSYESSNVIRIVTGLIAGISTTIVILGGFESRF